MGTHQKPPHCDDDEDVPRVLQRIARALEDTTNNLIIQEIRSMSAKLDTLTREVAESRTVTESAITLLEGLAQQIRDLSEDPAALQALADELDAQQTKLTTAITANTPTPPTP